MARTDPDFTEQAASPRPAVFEYQKPPERIYTLKIKWPHRDILFVGKSDRPTGLKGQSGKRVVLPHRRAEQSRSSNGLAVAEGYGNI